MSYNEQLRCNYLTTNHEGATAWRMTPELELYTTVVTTMGTDDKFYEQGEDRVRRIADLVRKVQPEFVAQLAIYTRERMHLRSVPMLLLVELARCHHGDSLVSRAVSKTVQRADEITELLMCYQWRTGKEDLSGLSNQLRKGLAEAFNHFDEYQFAKYNRKGRKVTLRDALILVHPKPKDEQQEAIFRKILNDELETPYTWETEFSKLGQQSFTSKEEKDDAKRATWQALIASGRLGYMATLRNLFNMLKASIDDESMQQVCSFLANPEAVKNSKQLPFRFLSAYLQLKAIVANDCRPFAKPLRNIQARLLKVKNAIFSRKQGMFIVSKRKVHRFRLKNCIGTCAKILGSWDFRFATGHHSYRVPVEVHVDHPTWKHEKELQRLEKNLQRLQYKEAKLKQRRYRQEENRVTHVEKQLDALLQALEQAASHSAANIPGFDEGTRVLLASDTSGSMCSPVSWKSNVMYYHIGILLSMLMKQRCPQAVTGMFGDIWKEYFLPSVNVLENTEAMLKRQGEVGYATNGHKVIDWLIQEHRVMDKVMLFTDMQLWNNHRLDRELPDSWNKYKLMAPDAKLYIFDLAGYGQSPITMVREDVFCIAGWSDKVFDLLAALERGESAIDEIRRTLV